MHRTPLEAQHETAGARMVPFAGWRMPLHYGSQIDEHHAVRRACGLFDVSHMLAVDLRGEGALALLQRVMASDPGRLQTDGAAQYGCMLNESGGVIDDLLVYRLAGASWRLVVNASRRDADLAWLRRHGADAVQLQPRIDLAMLALQGPDAVALAARTLELAQLESLPRFGALATGGRLYARTGYTGEDGLEIMLPGTEAVALWEALLAGGARPCGLGARDTLRLEAGLCLYGQDLDEAHSPLASGLARTVAWHPAERDFIGRQALEREATGPLPRFTGLLLEARGVMRAGQRVHTDRGEGRVTSGGFSPTLNRSVALARLPPEAGDDVEVEVRGRRLPARCVTPPFVRNGRIQVDP